MSTGNDWSREEVEATVSFYFRMLDRELHGKESNKAAENRQLRMLLNGRSKGAVEWKHGNISAVLLEMGYPYVAGYKPAPNYQDLLIAVVEERLAADAKLERLVRKIVEAVPKKGQQSKIPLPTVVAPPQRDSEDESKASSKSPRPIISPTRNYLELEAHNRALGRAGEEMILSYEQKRLWNAGQRRLADKIEHVSVTVGDGLGFDIASFEADGRPRLIEVKTTQFGPFTPFFASRNEVAVSASKSDEYHLYRLFKFTDHPRLFTLKGSLRQTCRLDPVQFAAIPI